MEKYRVRGSSDVLLIALTRDDVARLAGVVNAAQAELDVLCDLAVEAAKTTGITSSAFPRAALQAHRLAVNLMSLITIDGESFATLQKWGPAVQSLGQDVDGGKLDPLQAFRGWVGSLMTSAEMARDRPVFDRDEVTRDKIRTARGPAPAEPVGLVRSYDGVAQPPEFGAEGEAPAVMDSGPEVMKPAPEPLPGARDAIDCSAAVFEVSGVERLAEANAADLAAVFEGSALTVPAAARVSFRMMANRRQVGLIDVLLAPESDAARPFGAWDAARARIWSDVARRMVGELARGNSDLYRKFSNWHAEASRVAPEDSAVHDSIRVAATQCAARFDVIARDFAMFGRREREIAEVIKDRLELIARGDRWVLGDVDEGRICEPSYIKRAQAIVKELRRYAAGLPAEGSPARQAAEQVIEAIGTISRANGYDLEERRAPMNEGEAMKGDAQTGPDWRKTCELRPVRPEDLPAADENGWIKFPDGSKIMVGAGPGRPEMCKAFWADGTPLRGVPADCGFEVDWWFASALEAAQALAEGLQGPAAMFPGNPPAN